MKKFTKGFTLIELLIVIALLGALAVGLLAALDPFEQLKKGTDTGVRNTVAELHGGIIRYYAIKNIMPWCADATCTAKNDSFSEAAPNIASNLTTTTTAITTTGELKSDFATLAGTGTLGKIIVFGNNASAKVEVCFEPTAKSFLSDPNTKFSPTDGLANDNGGTCVNSTNATANTCLWCVN